MKKPEIWSDAMDYYFSLYNAADTAFSKKPSEINSFNFKYDPNISVYLKSNDNLFHRLSSPDILCTENNNPDDPHYQLRDRAISELKDQLREVNAGLSVSAELQAAPMFWAPYKEYLKTKINT